ncbi:MULTISPECIES: efflux RND transporter periplasmic adaptor subunit [unclassified Hyphomonas]|jgi:membrane fusion protein (multidrug efflux system)|uniref:Efflux transporter, RND family, MFP subunit n=1 Tax=Ostreococcus tauri TaxID=70448 RepID=A0A1Y5I8P8_OSTTA|nr:MULTISPECIES: efflux RND transporter periplasmic adaptor subunit [unclassified Hyphomonas]OUS44594.1 efflux transporter, RND family, MFP subunit [Ostreococcus tauri]MAA83824.1 efflux transporter periplasmic adaptor subunit [Hyphomonas sp.]MAL43183.1 efflux transporter periplasmic adaptor subunit [Hyphomonas sp.]MAX84616.1 efflux transporter periplasmic adaptor subunit [Hyphomonas sp.]MBO6582040.1 efflux RND transporter periplasmic adaptor subunit [Hyphomonas sp.]|tara:strand:- start:59521 stop:60702 length:1182 start_codon:yes stop_codon:yes gene_type:complete
MEVLRKSISAATLSVAFLLTACGNEGSTVEVPQQPAPVVKTLTTELVSVPNAVELTGRARAHAEAEIRPQVTGIIKERLFKEGDLVSRGQALYQIDADEYAADVRSAEAALARAQASANVAKETAKRFADLAKINAVSQQEYDQAAATAQEAEADIALQKAALDRARIDLARTRISSPIAGRIGRSSVTQGALVTQNQTETLANVLQIDPIYVDLTVSSNRVLNMRRQIASGRVASKGIDTVPVNIILSDDTTYPLQGELEFSEINVDESAGTVAVRALVPNPDGIILPGMFVRANFVAGMYENVITLPQSVVSRTPTGEASVMVVKDDNTIEQRAIQVEQYNDNSWIVLDGLEEGERVAVSNLQNLRAGVTVDPISSAAQISAARDSRSELN